MDNYSLEQKVGQLFFIGLPGPEVDVAAAELLDTVEPGGICLFARNIREAAQTRELLDNVRDRLPRQPLLSLDQEGGLVDRLRRVLAPMPAAGRIRTTEQAARLGSMIAEAVRILGFNMDFAPVVDVIDQRRSAFSNGLHSRAFGRSADDVCVLTSAFLDALAEGGILGCLKHFPGLGASEVDSHEELPLVNISLEELESIDLVPYYRLIAGGNVSAVMVAHAAYPAVGLQERSQDGKLLPSSLSSNIVTGLLRRRIGFEGVVITDDLEMGAILRNYGIEEACKMAVKAGNDMLAICASPEAIFKGHAAVAEAVRSGEIDIEAIDRSAARIERFRSKLAEPLDFDISRLNELSRDVEALNEQLN